MKGDILDKMAAMLHLGLLINPILNHICHSQLVSHQYLCGGHQ